MIAFATILLLAAAVLRTRYGRIQVARLLLRTARAIADIGERVLDSVIRKPRK